MNKSVLINSLKSGELPKVFYHITEKSKLDSIMKEGLIPQTGKRSSSSKYTKDGNDPLVYMTLFQFITTWKKSFERCGYSDLIVLECNCNDLKLKVRDCYREGLEVATANTIEPDRITLTNF